MRLSRDLHRLPPAISEMKPFYTDNLVTLFHGDCRELLSVITADCLITDPPYGVEFKGKVNKNKKHEDGYAKTIGDDEQFIREVVVPAIQLALSKCKRGAVFTGVRNLFLYPRPADIGDFFVEYGGGVGKWGFSSVNPVCYYGPDPYLEKGKGSRPNSWLVTEIAERNGHPCPKPLGWMRKLVQRVSWEGEIVLDPFAGSGMTLVAARELNRKAVGMEIEEKYCEIAARRLEVVQPALFTVPTKERQEQMSCFQ